VSLQAGPLPSSVAVADLDGNGLADIAVADLGDHTILVFWSPWLASRAERRLTTR
jgi:hypothetical protein